MTIRTINDLPKGAYILDCRPLGDPKILRVDPSTLSREKRRRICSGMALFSKELGEQAADLEHSDYKLEHKEGDDYEVVPRDHLLR